MQRARTLEAKEDRRQALIEAGLEEFYERGFAAARMEDIARRAGLSKGTIYLYFDSKEALFASIVEAVAIPNVERLEATADSAGNLNDVIDALTALAPIVLRESRVPKIMKVLVGDAPAFPEVASRYRKQVVGRVLAALSRVLRNAKETGEAEVGDPALAARLVAAPIVFSAVWRVVFGHDDEASFDIDALFALHGNMLKRAFGLEPSP